MDVAQRERGAPPCPEHPSVQARSDPDHVRSGTGRDRDRSGRPPAGGVAGAICPAAAPMPFGELTPDHGEGTERTAVIVQLGRLRGGPPDEPDVEVGVGVQALRPA